MLKLLVCNEMAVKRVENKPFAPLELNIKKPSPELNLVSNFCFSLWEEKKAKTNYLLQGNFSQKSYFASVVFLFFNDDIEREVIVLFESTQSLGKTRMKPK